MASDESYESDKSSILTPVSSHEEQPFQRVLKTHPPSSEKLRQTSLKFPHIITIDVKSICKDIGMHVSDGSTGLAVQGSQKTWKINPDHFADLVQPRVTQDKSVETLRTLVNEVGQLSPFDEQDSDAESDGTSELTVDSTDLDETPTLVRPDETARTSAEAQTVDVVEANSQEATIQAVSDEVADKAYNRFQARKDRPDYDDWIFGRIVRFLVGSQRNPFYVHHRYLYDQGGFHGLLSQRYYDDDGEMFTVELPDDDPRAFSHIVKYLYGDDPVFRDNHDVIAAYILGGKHGLCDFQTQCLTLFDLNVSFTDFLQAIKMVYDTTENDDQMDEFLEHNFPSRMKATRDHYYGYDGLDWSNLCMDSVSGPFKNVLVRLFVTAYGNLLARQPLLCDACTRGEACPDISSCTCQICETGNIGGYYPGMTWGDAPAPIEELRAQMVVLQGKIAELEAKENPGSIDLTNQTTPDIYNTIQLKDTSILQDANTPQHQQQSALQAMPTVWPNVDLGATAVTIKPSVISQAHIHLPLPVGARIHYVISDLTGKRDSAGGRLFCGLYNGFFGSFPADNVQMTLFS